jgi:hypothetical protein
LDRYYQLVKPSEKSFANTHACIRKIVYVAVTLDKDKRGRLLELACPGGFFIFIVQPEILKTFLEHYSAHNSTSSMCNYIIQIKCFITKYWECHSAIIMDQLDHIGQGITHEQMRFVVHTSVTITGLENAS